MTLNIKETQASDMPLLQRSCRKALLNFSKRRWYQTSLLILSHVPSKIGDNMANISTPFYLDLGFTKTVIGSVVKLINFWR